MNRIVIHGRLTRDPDLKDYTNAKGENGKVCNFSVAVNRSFGDDADFFNCTAFGKRAEVINEFFSKGREIVVEGSMQCDPYDDKDGNKRYPWKLMMSAFDFCGSKTDSSKSAKSEPTTVAGFEEIDDDDIPF